MTATPTAAAERPRRPLTKRRLLAALSPLALALVMAACAGSDGASATTAEDGRPLVVATTSIWADVVANVACDLAEVQTLIPVGADPHAFEPSLADRESMDNASLIVANGLFLEEGLEDTLQTVEAEGVPIFHLADHVSTIAYSFSDGAGSDGTGSDGTGGESADDHEHDHQSDDPHIWFDPVRVSAALPALAERLIDDAGLDRAAIEVCVESYQADLADLDSEISGLVAAVPEANRKLITNHDSLGYFADRYGFEIIGTVIPAPSGLAATNPAQLEELARLIEAADVPAIFAESQHSTDDADVLADQIGDVEVVTLLTGTLGEPGTDADTYLGFLANNAELITQALN